MALASFERPRVGPARYREHLRQLARDVGRHAGAAGDLAERARALNEIILLKHGYSGDELTYDDLQNANLMRVVDRRKGLPVALGILYMHAGRAQGWETVGLAFPGHFLIRLSDGPERLILDPFHGGQICGAAELRELLKATAGQDSELQPEHYTPVSDRDVLLRLQNNLKARLIQAQQLRAGGHGGRDDADAGSRPRRAVARGGTAARPARQYALGRRGARAVRAARPGGHGAAPGRGAAAAAALEIELSARG